MDFDNVGNGERQWREAMEIEKELIERKNSFLE